jgi:hypothetical protein
MNKDRYKNALLDAENINTERYVVASIRGKLRSLDYVNKMLDRLNYGTNYRLNRYALKKGSKFPRVQFHGLTEHAWKNSHCHLYLSIPPCYEYDQVVNIMIEEWAKLDTVWDKRLERYVLNPHQSHEIFSDKVWNENAYAIYSVKDFNKRDMDTYINL